MNHSIPMIFALATITSQAASIISLPGNQESATWSDLSAATYPGFGSHGNSTANWPSSIIPNVGTSSSLIDKMDGTAGYVSAANYIYDGGVAGGTFTLSDSDPIASMQTVVLQIEANQAPGTVNFSFNGGSQAISPDFTSSSPGDTYTVQSYQWDLSSLGAISDYTITWENSAPHTVMKRFDLDTSDQFAQVIPEPSAAILISLTSLALLRRRRAH
ncbi:hypothetical protein ACFQY0_18975 [Haloferula chungangensis]|uniref:PEP-CTERM sorting domain-containing protein n=1 Tax=Haloferula chungangensis TaxID=1048331 RepID=A0ABW2LA11_9BACT